MILRGTCLSLLSVAAMAGAGHVNADSHDQLPSANPPAGFSGGQFVDSTGCAFVRAEFAGETRWLPRLRADQSPVCGLKPSLAVATPEKVESAAAPTVENIASQPNTPAVETAAPITKPAPKIKRSRSSSAVSKKTPLRRATRTVRVTCQSGSSEAFSYIAQPGDVIACDRQQVAAQRGSVQVGTYRVEANAEATAQRLQAEGLPIRILKVRSGGNRYNVVMAGPFEGKASLQVALNEARGAGYVDAFVRY